MQPDYSLNSRKIIWSLIAAWLLLWFGSLLQDLLIFTTGIEGKIWLLDVDSEESLFTWFSTVLLFLAALPALVLGSQGRDALHWRLIAVLVLAMSVDEMLSLHEKLSGILSGTISTSGPLLFAWVIPAGALVLVLGIGFLPFVFRQPRKVAVMIVLAGALFVLGAIGMEMVAGAFLSGQADLEDGFRSPVYRVLTNLEEGLEVLGVILFIAALLTRCADVFPACMSKG